MDNIWGKRLIMGIISFICVSIVSGILKYDGGIYLKLTGIIITTFMAAQTITDSIGK